MKDQIIIRLATYSLHPISFLVDLIQGLNKDTKLCYDGAKMRTYLYTLALLLIIFQPIRSFATLVDIGQNSSYLFDDRTGYVWDMNLSRYNNIPYAEQLGVIKNSQTSFDVNQDGISDTLSWQFVTTELFVDMASYLGFDLYNVDITGYEVDRINNPTESSPLITFMDALKVANAPADTRDSTYWFGRIEGAGEMWLSGWHSTDIKSYSAGIELGDHLEWPTQQNGAWTVAEVNYGTNTVNTPEPKTMVLISFGLLGIVFQRQRRRGLRQKLSAFLVARILCKLPKRFRIFKSSPAW